jgi:hypothetical protein
LHRSAKLCVSLNYISKKRKEKDCIGWIILNLFDYKANLMNGKKNLYLWPSDSASSFTITQEKTFANLCQSGVSGQNPKKDFSLFKIEFLNKDNIYYPSNLEIKNYAKKNYPDSQDEVRKMKFSNICA